MHKNTKQINLLLTKADDVSTESIVEPAGALAVTKAANTSFGKAGASKPYLA